MFLERIIAGSYPSIPSSVDRSPLAQKLLAAKNYRAGTMSLRQVHFASVDLELHHNYIPGGDETVFDCEKRVAKRTCVMQPRAEDRFLCSFAHIFAGGYSAGYYSYKWAEVLSADAFGAFEEVGLDNEQGVVETGLRFRDTGEWMGGWVRGTVRAGGGLFFLDHA